MQTPFPVRGLMALGAMFVSTSLWATPMPGSAFSYNAQTTQSKYRTPEDILPRIPVISLIPRTFLFSGGYTVDLSITEMRIDHMVANSRCPRRNRFCFLAVSYSQPVGDNMFSSRFDFPLVSSDRIGGHWGPASVGDYVVHLANTPLNSPTLKLLGTARF